MIKAERADAPRDHRIRISDPSGKPVLARLARLVSLVQVSGNTESLATLKHMVTRSPDEIVVHHLRVPGAERQTEELRRWAQSREDQDPPIHLIETGIDLAELATETTILFAMAFDTGLVARSFQVQRPDPIDRIVLDPSLLKLPVTDLESAVRIMAATIDPYDLPRIVRLTQE